MWICYQVHLHPLQYMTSVLKVFVLGNEYSGQVRDDIREEWLRNSDIVLLDIVDTYRNLTLKSIGIHHWIAVFCTLPHFYFEVNSFIFVISYSTQRFLYGISNNGFYIVVFFANFCKQCNGDTRQLQKVSRFTQRILRLSLFVKRRETTLIYHQVFLALTRALCSILFSFHKDKTLWSHNNKEHTTLRYK